MASTRCGISAKQVEHETGVTYKTAWRMYKQIRKMLKEDCDPFTGAVEVDETYYGAPTAGKHGRGATNKTIVVGVAQRRGKVAAKVVPDCQSSTLIPFIEKRILPSTLDYTEELPSYRPLSRLGYDHRRIHHATKVWIVGDCHTNSIEGFWSLVKNGLRGIQHSVSAKYLETYFDEFAFRYNRRHDTTPMFESIMKQVEKAPKGE
jgi:transposase-like protein